MHAEARVIDLPPVVDDFHDYENVRHAAGDPVALEKATSRPRLDARRGQAHGLSRPAFREWSRGYRRTARTSEVASVSIPKGSDLTPSRTKPRGGLDQQERHATDWFGHEPEHPGPASAHTCSAGEPGTLGGSVEDGIPFSRTTVTLGRSEFFGCARPLPRLRVRTITVNLRCPRAEPPELPPYSVR